MSLTDKQKRDLKKLVSQLTPDSQEVSEIYDEIDRLDDVIDEVRHKLSSISTEIDNSLKKIEGILMSKMNDAISRFEASMASSQKETGEMIKKSRREIVAMIPDVDKAVNSKIPDISTMVKDHKKSTDQIIEEIRGEIRIAYSKFGGATMPRLLMVEVATAVSGDATLTMYNTKNKPVRIEVGGGGMVDKIVDPINYGYTVSGSAPLYTVTLVNGTNQPVYSFYQ